jgi:FK506-binding nuclear protein
MAMSANGKKKKENGKAEKDSKSKKEASVEEDSDDDEDDDETEMDETMESMNAEEDDEDDSLDDGSDEEGSDDDEEEDDDDEDEDDSDEETAPPPKKQQKTEKPAQNGKADKKNKQKNGTENGDAKKQQQKEKPEAGKIIKMQGGLQAQELKIGGGAEARPGKKVQVYYEGRLKTNNKTFDASKSGPGFKFTLGKGEVIKGWDLGVSGMKVGGKRRLVIPPALAYGQRGSPPAIPQNATLVFDVELKNVF